MKVVIDKVTEWYKANKPEDVYVFSWDCKKGYQWCSVEKNDFYLELFQNPDSISNAVRNGVLNKEAQQELMTLIQSGQHGVEHAEEVFLFEMEGRRYWNKISILNTFDEEAKCIRFVVNIIDFGKMTDVLEKMIYQMGYDELTDIYNVDKFYYETANILQKDLLHNYAIVRLDFDRFEIVNDLFGTKEGDKVLKYVGTVLKNLHLEGYCCCRVISDVFAMCVRYETDEDIVKLIKRLEQRISEYDIECRLAPYFGVYKISDRTIPVSIMLDYAKLACRSIKGNVINNYSFYSDLMHQEMINEIEIERDMEKALDENQFKLYLQPKYDIATREIIGADGYIQRRECWHQINLSHYLKKMVLL